MNIHLAGFTNLSRDHLDHRTDMKRYLQPSCVYLPSCYLKVAAPQ